MSVGDRGTRDRQRLGQKRIVGDGGDALAASVLRAAIVHRSLLEAKSARTEQRFLRDLSLSAGMPEKETQAQCSEDTVAFHCNTFTKLSWQFME